MKTRVCVCINGPPLREGCRTSLHDLLDELPVCVSMCVCVVCVCANEYVRK